LGRTPSFDADDNAVTAEVDLVAVKAAVDNIVNAAQSTADPYKAYLSAAIVLEVCAALLCGEANMRYIMSFYAAHSVDLNPAEIASVVVFAAAPASVAEPAPVVGAVRTGAAAAPNAVAPAATGAAD
jgi:hypothetical protein